jgi:GAF domain-containing protein
MSAAFSGQLAEDRLPSRLRFTKSTYARALSGSIIALTSILLLLRTLLIGGELTATTNITAVFALGGSVLALAASLRGRSGVAGIILTLTLLGGTVFAPLDQVRTLAGSLALMTAALLTSPRIFMIMMGMVAGGYIFIQLDMAIRQQLPMNTQRIDLLVVGVTTIAVGGIFRYVYSVAESTTDDAETAFQRLSAVSNIGRYTGRLLDLPTLYRDSVMRIKDAFGFYHVQIFLVDEARVYADLVASTGEAGRRLLERNHRLAIGSESVIGRVTQSNDPVLINDTDNQPGHAFNPLLPETRAELALPMQMQIGGENVVVGALDVQSVSPNAFSPTDVQALQALANQLAVAIRNAQLFQSQDSSLRENQQLFAEARTNLSEIERLNRQLTRQAWDTFMTSHPDIIGATADRGGISEQAEWTDLMRQACQSREMVEAVQADGTPVIAAPVMLRDELLGAIEVTGGDNISLDLRAAISGISTVLAVNLENRRLLEETQAASAQEYRINQVVSKFQEADSIDELLQITLSELAQTLEAEGGSIRVGLSPAEPVTR